MRKYICKECKEEFEYDEESLWGHIQMAHEDVFDYVQDLETPDMLEECYEDYEANNMKLSEFIEMLQRQIKTGDEEVEFWSYEWDDDLEGLSDHYRWFDKVDKHKTSTGKNVVRIHVTR